MAEIYRIENNDREDTSATLQTLLESCDATACVDDATDVRSNRFHELVDKEFLGILTSEETQELEVLTKWRDDQKAAFYRNVAVG